MTILKKNGKCNNCGEVLKAGSTASFKKLYTDTLDGRGFRTKSGIRWVVVHESLVECEAHEVKKKVDYVKYCRANNIIPNVSDSQIARIIAHGYDYENL